MAVALSVVYLALTTFVGTAVTGWLPMPFTRLERIAYGYFLGLIPIGLLALILAIAFGFGPADFWAPALIASIAGIVALGRRRSSIVADVREIRPVRSWFWAAIALLPWIAYFAGLFAHAFVAEPDGLYAGHVNIWGDWALHLSYASSFAYGHNLPPSFPVLAGEHYEYHFMPDFVAAGFAANGMPVTSALALGSFVSVSAMLAVFYSAATRLSTRPAAGALAIYLFLLSGGVGFVLLFQDLRHALVSGVPLSDFLGHFPRTYTQMPNLNYQWLTPIFAYVVPQRSMAFGLSVLLIVLVLLREATVEWSRLLFVVAGVLVGSTPLYHLHATIAVGLLSGLFAVLDLFLHRGEIASRIAGWIAYFAPLSLLALPTMSWMYPSHSTGLEVRQQFGWLAYQNTRDGFLAFWFKNLDFFIPLALVAHAIAFRVRPKLAWLALPAWALFAIANVFILQPWDWDNTKWFLPWFLVMCILVSWLLVWLTSRSRAWLLATVPLVIVMCLSGAADAWSGLDYAHNRVLFASSEELDMARWAKSHTDPHAVFLTAEVHNEAIPTLAGRRIFIGYPGWLWVFTLPYADRDADARAIYSGGPEALRLLRDDGIAYVVVGPVERGGAPSGMGANEAFFAAHFPVAWGSRDYRVYRV